MNTAVTAAALISCGLATLHLPDAPVTLTEFRAQLALAAFLKTALVYLLPLHAFLLLLPFYLVAAAELKAREMIAAFPADVVFISPRVLALVCMGAIVYSLVTTFFLLDHLQTEAYHGLFVSLVFVRFIVYFGLGFGSLLWYKAAFGKATVPLLIGRS